MKYRKEVAILSLIITLITLSGVYILYLYIRPLILQTAYPQPIWANVHGTVTLTKDWILYNGNKKPDTVYIYYPYYSSFTQFYCGKIPYAGFGIVNWTSSVSGFYNATIKLPVATSVYATNDCNSCNYNSAFIVANGDSKEVDIQLNSSQCKQSTAEIPTDVNGILAQVDNQNNLIENDIAYNSGLNNDQTLLQYKTKSVTFKQEAVNSQYTNYNQSLLDAYYALWYSNAARYEESKFRLSSCVNQTQDLINSHNNSLCYAIESSSHDELVLDNQAVNAYYFFPAEDYNTVDTIRTQIQNLYSYWSSTNSQANTCFQNLYTVVNNTFNFQKPYCDAKENLVSFFSWSPYLLAVVISFIVGLILENKFNLLKKAREKIDIADKKFDKWQKSISPISKLLGAVIGTLFFGIIFLTLYGFAQYVGYLLVAFFSALIGYLFTQIHEHQKRRSKRK